MSRGGKTFRVPSDTESEASRYEDAFETPDSPPSDTDPLSYSALLFEPRPESLTLFTTLLSDTLSHNHPQDDMAPKEARALTQRREMVQKKSESTLRPN